MPLTPRLDFRYKLRETMDTHGLEFKPDWVVVDVGASPGGWSRYSALRWVMPPMFPKERRL